MPIFSEIIVAIITVAIIVIFGVITSISGLEIHRSVNKESMKIISFIVACILFMIIVSITFSHLD